MVLIILKGAKCARNRIYNAPVEDNLVAFEESSVKIFRAASIVRLYQYFKSEHSPLQKLSVRVAVREILRAILCSL